MESSMSETLSYEVFIDRLQLSMRIGCKAAERFKPQMVELSVRFQIEAGTDINELDRSVCYFTASQMAREHAQQQEWVLVENYLESLTALYFEHFPACSEVDASLSKFVVTACSAAGARIRRRRS